MQMSDNNFSYRMIGSELSLYSGKLRSYLLQKHIPFRETGTNPVEFFFTAPQKTRAAAVPILISPQGEWLQDTSAIIDEMEKRFPAIPILPKRRCCGSPLTCSNCGATVLAAARHACALEPRGESRSVRA